MPNDPTLISKTYELMSDDGLMADLVDGNLLLTEAAQPGEYNVVIRRTVVEEFSRTITVADNGGELGPTTATISADATPGTIIAAITGLATGEEISTVIPNDGRLALDGTRRNLIVGLTAITAGSIAATLTTSNGRVLAMDVDVADGVVDQGYRFASNRQRLPTVLGSAVVAGTAYLAASEVFFSPDYAQNAIRVCLTNFYVDQTGASSPERQNGNERVVEGVAIEIGGVKTPFTFGGQAGVTMSASQPFTWSDPLDITLPANTSFKIITADHVAVGGFRPAGYRPSSAHGDRYTYGSTSQAAFLTAGTPATPSTGVYLAGPAAIVGKPISVTPSVPLVVGDSIAFGANEDARSSSIRGQYGWIGRGLDDDTAGVGRFAFGMFAIPGTRLSNLANTSGEWAIRKALLAEVGNPYSCVLSEMGVNSVAGNGSAALIADFTSAATFLRGLAGSKRVIQTTLTPRTSDGGNNGYSTVASQTVGSINSLPNGERWALNDHIKSLPANVDRVIDVTPVWIDSIAQDKWKSMGRESVLAANVSSGTSISVTGTPPIVGDQIIIGAGASGFIDREVTAVTGSGPYTVTLRTAVVGSFLAAANVRATPSTDGVHPTSALHVEASQAIIAAKQSDIFN